MSDIDMAPLEIIFESSASTAYRLWFGALWCVSLVFPTSCSGGISVCIECLLLQTCLHANVCKHSTNPCARIGRIYKFAKV